MAARKTSDPRLKALAERLQSVLDETGLSQSALSTKADLARGHVGLLLNQRIGEPTYETIEALAQAGGVRGEWLWSGRGPRRGLHAVPSTDERYEMMPVVRDAARSDGVTDEFVADWVAKLELPGQPSFGVLYDLLRASWNASRGRLVGVRETRDEDV